MFLLEVSFQLLQIFVQSDLFQSFSIPETEYWCMSEMALIYKHFSFYWDKWAMNS